MSSLRFICNAALAGCLQLEIILGCDRAAAKLAHCLAVFCFACQAALYSMACWPWSWELLNFTDDGCHAGGGCQAVCTEDNQLGHLGVPAVCHPDQR